MTRFLREWIRDPLGVGAVAPSSRWLASAMTREITPATGSVIELGPGTGVFTRALLAAGLPEYGLVLVERSELFAGYLRREFPAALVIHGDASETPLPPGAGAVVSGLPLRSMHRATRRQILRRAFGSIREGGALYQFTYGWGFPVAGEDMAGLGLVAERVSISMLNFPPATIWKVTRG